MIGLSGHGLLELGAYDAYLGNRLEDDSLSDSRDGQCDGRRTHPLTDERSGFTTLNPCLRAPSSLRTSRTPERPGLHVGGQRFPL